MKSAALLRKDLRLYRLPLLGSLVLVVAPYLFVVETVGSEWSRLSGPTLQVQERDETVPSGFKWVSKPNPLRNHAFVAATGLLVNAAMAGFGFAVISAAAYGALAFAKERKDGSAGFMAMLPVKRSQIVASKLTAALVCLLIPVVFHSAGIGGWLYAARNVPIGNFWPVIPMALSTLANCAAVALLLFGSAWLASALSDRPVMAAFIALEVAFVTLYVAFQLSAPSDDPIGHTGMTDLVSAVFQFVLPFEGGSMSRYADAGVRNAALAVGGVSLVAGTGAYLRRVSP